MCRDDVDGLLSSLMSTVYGYKELFLVYFMTHQIDIFHNIKKSNSKGKWDAFSLVRRSIEIECEIHQREINSED